MSDMDEPVAGEELVWNWWAVVLLAIGGALVGVSMSAVSRGDGGLQTVLLALGTTLAVILATVVWRQHHLVD